MQNAKAGKLTNLQTTPPGHRLGRSMRPGEPADHVRRLVQQVVGRLLADQRLEHCGPSLRRGSSRASTRAGVRESAPWALQSRSHASTTSRREFPFWHVLRRRMVHSCGHVMFKARLLPVVLIGLRVLFICMHLHRKKCHNACVPHWAYVCVIHTGTATFQTFT